MYLQFKGHPVVDVRFTVLQRGWWSNFAYTHGLKVFATKKNKSSFGLSLQKLLVRGMQLLRADTQCLRILSEVHNNCGCFVRSLIGLSVTFISMLALWNLPKTQNVCRSVCRSVGWSDGSLVGWLVGWSIIIS